MKKFKQVMVLLFVALITPFQTFASEADIAIPDLHAGEFHIFGQIIKAWDFCSTERWLSVLHWVSACGYDHRLRNKKPIFPCLKFLKLSIRRVKLIYCNKASFC